MEQLLKDKMQKLLEQSYKAGAQKADVILSRGNSFSLTAQNGKIDKYQVSGSQVMGVRVIVDQKIGLSYSEALDEDSLNTIAYAAVENAKNSEVNPYEDILVQEGEKIFQSDDEKDKSSVDEKIDFCLSLESEVKKRDSKVNAVPYNMLNETNVESYYLNSLGTFTFEDDHYMNCYTSALIKSGSESSMHFQSTLARTLSTLDFEKCISESLFHANEWLGAKPIQTGEYDVIFTPDTYAQLFSCFSNIYSAKAAMEKTNPFADRLGEKVFSSKISISDIPQYKNSFIKSYVDAEGMNQSEICLIKEGVLSHFLHNSSTANYFKTKSNGRAARGAKSALGTTGTTKVIGVGDISLNDLKNGKYFEIHSMQGLHSGANSVSGDFSFGASGYLMDNGKSIQPVKGVTVSGNFHKMMANINMMGNTLEANNENSFFAPLMRFEKMSIAG